MWQQAAAATKSCPFYKRIPGTAFTVDAFRYGAIANVTAYFLTHYHSDHYGGLTRDFNAGPIYCSLATANLVCTCLGVARSLVHPLDFNRPYLVQGVRVTLLDANHCPGAALILFECPNSQVHLHTGDFRATPSMLAKLQHLGFRTRPDPQRYEFPRELIADCKTADDEFKLFSSPPQVPLRSISSSSPSSSAAASAASPPTSLKRKGSSKVSATSQLAASMSAWLRSGSIIDQHTGEDSDDDVEEETRDGENEAAVFSEDEDTAVDEDTIVSSTTSTPFSIESALAKTPPIPDAAPTPRGYIFSVYLDTTYCQPKHAFPAQADILAFVRAKVRDEMATAKKPPLFVVGTYQIGKEKVVRAIADALGSKIYADAAKRRILVQLQDDDLNRLITDDPAKACVHITSMADVRISALKKYQAKYSQQWPYVVGFCPTGWTHTEHSASLPNLRPTVSGAVKLFSVPYSEHSSYDEMRAFVSQVKPAKVIPTVNIGSESHRQEMQKYFADWLQVK